MNEVIVVGYPRSGNTWLARLIADALDSPLVGLPSKGAIPIGQEGQNRPGKHLIRQLHLTPTDDDDSDLAIPNPYRFYVRNWTGEKIVLIMRDIRDVTVSTMHYWEIATLPETIRKMAIVEWPMGAADRWDRYNHTWLNCSVLASVIKYEELSANPLLVLQGLLQTLDLAPAFDLSEVIERQSIETRRRGFTGLNRYHPYGPTIQLKNLRKGIVGDWRNCFTRETAEMVHNEYFETMQEFGYETNPDWWREL